MSLFLSLVIHTSNVLAIFIDPFEFEGDYGPQVNPVREKVFELIVSKEALARNQRPDGMTEDKNLLVAQAIAEDKQHGPILSELVTPELINELIHLQQNAGLLAFSEKDLYPIFDFIHRYGEQKIFRFFRHTPTPLLSIDKALRDQAAREGRTFDLPILSSTQLLNGQDSHELKLQLLEVLFNEKNFNLTKPEEELLQSLNGMDEKGLRQLLGEKADPQDLKVFCTRAGQLIFFWLYHALDLHLIAEEPGLIDQINQTKVIFVQTIGNPQERAQTLRKKLLEADTAVLFTQESDFFLPFSLVQDHRFLPVGKQNPFDGCFVFLRSDLWKPAYELIPLPDYAGYKNGKVNIVLAALRGTGEKFLLASCHGHSTNPEDGRNQIRAIVSQFDALSKQPENRGLQLVIGIDANTKSAEDVRLFRELLDSLGLVATNCGPTTIKRRMVTSQHDKAGVYAIDEEDYLITLKPERGGRYRLEDQTVGFRKERPDLTKPLPDLDNPSDHYPVGARLVQ